MKHLFREAEVRQNFLGPLFHLILLFSKALPKLWVYQGVVLPKKAKKIHLCWLKDREGEERKERVIS